MLNFLQVILFSGIRQLVDQMTYLTTYVLLNSACGANTVMRATSSVVALHVEDSRSVADMSST